VDEHPDVLAVEVIETPQRDWWVVVDGRVVELHLAEEGGPGPLKAALQAAHTLAQPYGYSVLALGTTWRSRAFDHLERLSCLRGTCCRADPTAADTPISA
jgi:hypothetical protein